MEIITLVGVSAVVLTVLGVIGAYFYQVYKSSKQVSTPASPVATGTTSSTAPTSSTSMDWMKVAGGVGAVIALIIVVPIVRSMIDGDEQSDFERHVAEEVDRQVKARLASQDSTFYMTITSEWSEPIAQKLGQYVSLQRQDSVAYEVLLVERGWTYLIPEKVIPHETTIKLLDKTGGVIKTFKADGNGWFRIPVKGTHRVRVLGAPKAIFEVRVRES